MAPKRATAKTVPEEIPTLPGTPYAGGFYVGRFQVERVPYALIVAPNGDGDRKNIEWNASSKNVSRALSFYDGAANTAAMAKAGSELAKWAQSLAIAGFSDWYLPSLDELEICYRFLKPGTEANSLYGRSGINVSALPASYPYTAELPAQTTLKPFRTGGKQAFADAWYWTSTQHASDADYAWMQVFGDGFQGIVLKGNTRRARAVRRIKL